MCYEVHLCNQIPISKEIPEIQISIILCSLTGLGIYRTRATGRSK